MENLLKKLYNANPEAVVNGPLYPLDLFPRGTCANDQTDLGIHTGISIPSNTV